ncbi:spherulin 4-like cell surface protein [Lasiosphaeria hispida]|uniref:Spherulin 4-like cell surface protein n=1 Tax=Lasiosphaeria hispida TaxID=260671 RepID=A0AAJ0M8V3_9PEZI|nr:spherulin 4-like cell surface protein [Lasiosphaeria hispida]
MNLEKLLPKRGFQRRPMWFWSGVTVVAVIIITAIAVPLGIVLPKRGKPPSASIILPLYIYPHDITIVESRKDLKFTVVVNPSSGPGSESLPDSHYREAIGQFGKYPNVELLGYVRTSYAKRSIEDVIRDINVYAGWSSQNMSLSMNGIFLDEAPHQYSHDADSFMRKVGQEINGATGLREPKTIVHNPGVVPDARFHGTGANITVVFEHDYDSWRASGQAAVAALAPNKRDTYSLIVHSVPQTLNSGELQDFLASMSSVAQHLYITTNRADYYESFADDWSQFVSAVPG